MNEKGEYLKRELPYIWEKKVVSVKKWEIVWKY